MEGDFLAGIPSSVYSIAFSASKNALGVAACFDPFPAVVRIYAAADQSPLCAVVLWNIAGGNEAGDIESQQVMKASRPPLSISFISASKYLTSPMRCGLTSRAQYLASCSSM
jgi:hypothetical protein